MRRHLLISISYFSICLLAILCIPKTAGGQDKNSQQRLFSPPAPPFKSYISGIGVVEASSNNIFIGSPLNRIVDQIPVEVGMKVKKGDVLVRLEDKDLEAELLARQVEYESAQAQFKKLQSLPRPEDLRAAEAAAKSAHALLVQTSNQYDIVRSLQDSRAISQDEINRRHYNYLEAEAKWEQAKADLEKTQAGTWAPDLEIAHLAVLTAQANVNRVKAEIERTIIRSPIDGTVLQIKIQPGELPPMDTSRSPIMIVGNIDQLHLRVNINQFDAPYFNPKAKAIAFLQGDARIEFPLEFVRVDPYLVNKQSLTNDIFDKVDTRVLQVIYRFNPENQPIFVGQLMDVFIETQYSSHE